MLNFKKITYATILSLTMSLSVAHANWTTGITTAGSFALPNASVDNIVINFLEWILAIFTLLAVLAFVITGIMFMTAGANADTAKKAKDMVFYSIMGIVIGLSGYIIVSLIDGILLSNIY